MTALSSAVVADSSDVLIIERVFDAPRELVFKCWTEPEHFARWIGPKGFHSEILSLGATLRWKLSDSQAGT